MYAADEVYDTAELEGDLDDDAEECGAEIDAEIDYDHVYITRCANPAGQCWEHPA